MTLSAYLFTLLILAYASYCDLKTREVSDLVWIVGCPVGLTLSLADFFAGKVSAVSLAVSPIASACIGIALYAFGLVGGADALALLFIGLTLPAYPEGFPLFKDPLGSPFFAAFCNSVILSLACPVSVFVLNVFDMVRGRNPFRGIEVRGTGDLLVLLFTARRVSLDRLLSGLHYFPAERLVEEDGRLVRQPVYLVRAEADLSEITARMAEKRELYNDGVLASPTIPMIVFLTLGLALLPIGNLLFLAVLRIMGL